MSVHSSMCVVYGARGMVRNRGCIIAHCSSRGYITVMVNESLSLPESRESRDPRATRVREGALLTM